MSIKVYSTPNCVQCNATYRSLDALGVEYEKIDLSEDTEARKMVTETLGYRQVPVVVSGDKHWSGFKPDMIRSLKAV